MNIIIERMSDDQLVRNRWHFSVLAGAPCNGIKLRLDEWVRQSRKSRRHKWELDGEAYRHRFNDGHHHHGFRLPAALVPFQDDVVEEAKSVMLSKLFIEGPQDPPPKTL